ncbi:MAG: HNH endonuclease [bacterium]|nr:HNH endonuclease [bacterium]
MHVMRMSDGYQKRMRYLRVHYIVPISLGGTECLTNLKTLCHICSRRVEGRYSADRKRRTVVAEIS